MSAGGPLTWRKPASAWIPATLVVAPLVGAIPLAFWMSAAFPTFSSWLGFAQAHALVGVPSLVASLVFGGAWTALTYHRPRHRRASVIGEAILVGWSFALVAAAGFAGASLARAAVDGALESTELKTALGFGAFVALYGTLVSLFIAPFAGAVGAVMAFEQTGEPAPPPTE